MNKFFFNNIKYDNWHRVYEQYFKPIKIDNQSFVSKKMNDVNFIFILLKDMWVIFCGLVSLQE